MFSTFLKTKRQEQNLSQYELSYRTDVPATRISQIENGKGCTIWTAHKLLKALGVKTIPTDDLQVQKVDEKNGGE